MRGARLLLPAAAVAAMAAALLTAGAVTVPAGGGPGSVPTAPVAAQAADPLAAQVRTLQDDLRRAPGNHVAWAQLGTAYVQQARLSADPTLYGKAEGPLAESLRRHRQGNDLALSGQASLALTAAVVLSVGALVVLRGLLTLRGLG